MPKYKCYSQSDVNMGDKYEAKMKPILEQRFGNLCQRSKNDKDDVFDFSNDRVYIDTKCRRCTKNQYPSTMVGENKVLAGLQKMTQGFEVYFVFGFTDQDCIWRLDREQYEIRYGGRSDRGMDEIKSYCYVPIEYLEDIINNADCSPEESFEGRMDHAETVQRLPQTTEDA